MATTVGERLKAAREELQRSRGERPNQSALAREIGIAAPSLNDIESGKSKEPAAETLLAIRDAGINPDYVMRGKGPKLIDQIERQLNQQTILSMMADLDDGDQQVLIDMAKALIRKKPGGGSGNDPFKQDPPGG